METPRKGEILLSKPLFFNFKESKYENIPSVQPQIIFGLFSEEEREQGLVRNINIIIPALMKNATNSTEREEGVGLDAFIIGKDELHF